MPVFTYRSELDHPVEEVFRWHTRPGAMERLTPPWEDVTVLERSGGMDDGGTVTLQFRKGPSTLKWTVKHTAFEENVLFKDEQVSGPFKRWSHVHRFIPLDGGRRCEMVDEVEWEPPLGGVGELVAGGFIGSDLEKLFRFRHRRLAGDLQRQAQAGIPNSLTVALTGASGLIGSEFTNVLTTGGHRVLPVTRRPDAFGGGPGGTGAIGWDPSAGEAGADTLAAALEGVDAVVHLSGENIAGGRWTDEKKTRIMESRRDGTRLVAAALARMGRPPGVFLSMSAVGYYGNRGDALLDEEASPGKGFLPRVCQEWEASTEPARRRGIRTVLLRTGVVLTPRGGALEQMLTPFKLGVGGRLGSGRQYMSWIDMDDQVGLMIFALGRSALSGPVNATAPHPVTNATFTTILGRVINRPTLVPVPSLALKAMYGEMGEALLLEGQRVVPRKALDAGFAFDFDSVEDSLNHQLGRG